MAHLTHILKTLSAALACLISLSAAVPGQAASSALTIPGCCGSLAVTLTLPEPSSLPAQAASRSPVAVICHGFGGSQNERLLSEISSALLARGIGSVLFDFNGHGRSDGAFSAMTIPGEIEDLKKVTAYVRSLPQVSSVAVIGHSQGAVVAAMAAGETQDYAAMVLLSVAGVLVDDASRGMILGVRVKPDAPDGIVARFAGGSMPLGREYVSTARDLPFYETASRYRGPVLLVHGLNDRIVPSNYSRYLGHVLPDSRLQMLSSADHMFSGREKEVAGICAEFLTPLLVPAAAH